MTTDHCHPGASTPNQSLDLASLDSEGLSCSCGNWPLSSRQFDPIPSSKGRPLSDGLPGVVPLRGMRDQYSERRKLNNAMSSMLH